MLGGTLARRSLYANVVPPNLSKRLLHSEISRA
jgi:hypothetical protein